jgi:exodeoxyribonuclease X
VTTFAVIDFETTGLKPPAAVIECGVQHAVLHPTGLADGTRADGWIAPRFQLLGNGRSQLFNPGDQVITPENRAIHHISPEWLAPIATRFEVGPFFVLLQNPWPRYIVAHSMSFEQQWAVALIDELFESVVQASQFLRPRWICTQRCARRLWPDLTSHANQALRYSLHPEEVAVSPQFDPPHRALPDARLSAHHLAAILQHQPDPEVLAQWSAEPQLLKRLRSGKYKDQPVETVPPDYWDWLLRQPDLDEDTAHTARHFAEGYLHRV